MMEFGLEHNDIEEIQQVLLQHPAVEKAIIYGSRAKGNYRPSSDIDLTLIGESLDLKLQFRIELEIDDLLLPYKLDLSIFHQIENPDLIDHIQRVGKVFYQRK